jgi:AcrR family transcriptional regulator
MPRPRQVSDERILDVARDCFVECGAGTPIALVAARLGVSQPALFKRFGTKEDLLLAALAPSAVPEWMPLVEQGPDERDLREQLREIARAMTEDFARAVPSISVLRSTGISPAVAYRRRGVPPLVRAREALAGFITRAQSSGRARACDADALATMFIGALHVRIFLKHVAGDEASGSDAESYIDEVVSVVCDRIESASDAPSSSGEWVRVEPARTGT